MTNKLNLIKIFLFIILLLEIFIFILGAPLNHVIQLNIVKIFFDDKNILYFILFGFLTIVAFIVLCIIDSIKSKKRSKIIINILLIIYFNITAFLLINFIFLWTWLIIISAVITIFLIIFEYIIWKENY